MSRQKTILSFLGLGSMQAWLWTFYMNGPVLYGVLENKSLSVEAVFSLFLVFHSLSFLLLGIFAEKTGSLMKKPVLICISAAILSLNIPVIYPVLAIFGSHPGNAAMILFLAASGLSASVMILSLGEVFSGMNLKISGITYSMAVLFATGLFYLTMYIPSSLQYLLVSLLPASAMVFLLLLRHNKEKNPVSKSHEETSKYPFNARFTLLVLFFYLVGGLMQRLITLNVVIPNNEIYWLTNIVYCLAALSAGILIFMNSSIELRHLYLPVLPVLGVGFIILPVLSGNYVAIPFMLYQIGFALFDMFTWLLFAYLASGYRHPSRVFGYGMFLITVSIPLGNILFDKITNPASPDEIEIKIISIAASIIMFICTLVFKGDRNTFSGWEFGGKTLVPVNAAPVFVQATVNESLPPFIQAEAATESLPSFIPAAAADEVPLSAANDLIKESPEQKATTSAAFLLKSPLTPREEQILQLLLKGRNNPYIRENLNISVNTLKTHLRNIYQKIGVENRQALIDVYHKR